jgi:hypothetical protein
MSVTLLQLANILERVHSETKMMIRVENFLVRVRQPYDDIRFQFAGSRDLSFSQESPFVNFHLCLSAIETIKICDLTGTTLKVSTVGVRRMEFGTNILNLGEVLQWLENPNKKGFISLDNVARLYRLLYFVMLKHYKKALKDHFNLNILLPPLFHFRDEKGNYQGQFPCSETLWWSCVVDELSFNNKKPILSLETSLTEQKQQMNELTAHVDQLHDKVEKLKTANGCLVGLSSFLMLIVFVLSLYKVLY